MSPLIKPLDPVWFQRAADYQARLTMPAGALGRVLDVGRRLCAVQETLRPEVDPAAVVVLAGDHGVAEEGVSAYPPEVTGQMVANFLRGGAAVNALAGACGAQVVVADLGVRQLPVGCDPGGHPGWVGHLRLAAGTRNFSREPAMTADQLGAALAAGRTIVRDVLAPRGVRVVVPGEMGIGNSTSAAALTAALTGEPAARVTGRGTGVDDTGWRRKLGVVEAALALHFPRPGGTVTADAALRAVGGFEIAGLVGLTLEAAAARMVVVLDGFISSVAGLLAVRLEPAARDYLVAGHLGVEPGHRVALERLDLQPLLDLGLRLGEGSGGVLALPVLRAAAAVLRDMATFAGAGVSGSSG